MFFHQQVDKTIENINPKTDGKENHLIVPAGSTVLVPQVIENCSLSESLFSA